MCNRNLISLIYTPARTNESAHVALRYEGTLEELKSESPPLTRSLTDKRKRFLTPTKRNQHEYPHQHSSGKKNPTLGSCTGIQHIEQFQCYLPLVNDRALHGMCSNVRSACRRYLWCGDNVSHHLCLHAEAR